VKEMIFKSSKNTQQDC